MCLKETNKINIGAITISLIFMISKPVTIILIPYSVLIYKIKLIIQLIINRKLMIWQ